jgi:hypothetical protein
VFLHLFGQQISIPCRRQGRKQPVAREPVEETWGIQAAVIAPQEMNNCALGLRELRGREIDGLEDEDQLGRWYGRLPRFVHGANLCRLAVVKKSEIPRLEVRNRVPCRVRYNQVDAEEAIPHDGIGGAQGRQWLLRNGWISQRRGLSACPASPKNYHACEKSRALRVESIQHDFTCPGRLAASISGAPSARVAASPRSDAQTEAMHRQSHACDPPVNTDGLRPLPVSLQADSVSGSNHRLHGKLPFGEHRTKPNNWRRSRDRWSIDDIRATHSLS